MTRAEINEKIASLEKEIAILKNTTADDEKWFPKDGERYWYVSDDGEVNSVIFERKKCWRRWDIEIGNFFRTEEEAEFHRECLLVKARVKAYAEPKSAKWDGETKRYRLYYSLLEGKIHIERSCVFINDTDYFVSEEIAQKVIDEIGKEDLIKYYFCIGEESKYKLA